MQWNIPGLTKSPRSISVVAWPIENSLVRITQPLKRQTVQCLDVILGRGNTHNDANRRILSSLSFLGISHASTRVS